MNWKLVMSFIAASTAVLQSPASLQTAVTSAMAGRQGYVVVLDAASGEVIAQHRIASAAKRLLSPGSIIKPFTLAALLDANIINGSSSKLCERTLTIAGHNLNCSHVRGAEPMTPVDALAYSCNNYFAFFSSRFNSGDLLREYTSFGLISRSGLFTSEATGYLKPAVTLEERQLQALGISSVQVTPLEVAAAYRRLALIKRENGLRARVLAPVFEGLAAATQYGTARFGGPAGVRVAGKTGTATERSGQRSHAWFAGFAPEEFPAIVVVVFLETGAGGADAAPVAKRIFEAYDRK